MQQNDEREYLIKLTTGQTFAVDISNLVVLDFEDEVVFSFIFLTSVITLYKGPRQQPTSWNRQSSVEK